MNIEKREKDIDRSRLNVGTEIECIIVDPQSLMLITPEVSQRLFVAHAERNGWNIFCAPHNNEAQEAVKEIHGKPYIMGYDASYALFEFASPPVGSLQELEELQAIVLSEFLETLKDEQLLLWPFEVAPRSTGLFNHLGGEERTDLVQDNLSNILTRAELMDRFCYIASEQVSLDVPIEKMIPMVNALFKNVGTYISRFSTAPVFANGKKWNAGRYYWLNDCSPELYSDRYMYGVKAVYPPHEFINFTDYYFWLWNSTNTFVIRNGSPWVFVHGENEVSLHDFLRTGKAKAWNLEKEVVDVQLEKQDIEFLFLANWMDFKPHYDFDQSYTVEEFLEYYQQKNLEGFFQKYCQHAWIEVRPCAAHYENNAMDVPRYFYEIFSDIDAFLKKSQSISWEEGRRARDAAIGYD